MQVTVYRVHIPPMSTIAYASGKDEEGDYVLFAGDHRPMYEVGEAVEAATDESELPVVEVESWQLL